MQLDALRAKVAPVLLLTGLLAGCSLPGASTGTTGIGMARAHLGLGQIAELREELNPAFVHKGTQLLIVIGKEQEGAGRRELLPLKQHWSRGPEKEESRQRLILSCTGQFMQTCAIG